MPKMSSAFWGTSMMRLIVDSDSRSAWHRRNKIQQPLTKTYLNRGESREYQQSSA